MVLLSINLVSASAINLDDNDDSNELNEISIENINQNSYSSSNVLEKAHDSQNSEDFYLELNEDTHSSNLKIEEEKFNIPSSNLKIEEENNHSNDSNREYEVDENNSSDDSINKSFIISQENLTKYFDDEGILKTEYGGSILFFEGDFEDKGVLTIDKNNTKITGDNTVFYNTVFNLNASEIILANLNFVLDKSFPDNHNAGLYIGWDNITVYNITMNYTSPTDVNAMGIYSNDNIGLNLINNTINFIGHNDFDGYNYAIMLTYSYDAYVYNNLINADLPLRDVDWSYGIYGGVWMDKVSSFAAGECTNLRFTNNKVYSTINHGVYADTRYPTLSSVLIYACNNAIIDNNDIKINDFNTEYGQINYLYGLDIYRLDDVTIVNNTIEIFTLGGGTRMGTAYPIQVTGPANNIKVAYNNLTSFSFGPNIGIYSENYYGSTKLDIISNFINITGKAGTDSWSLVSGIEVQDSDDRILNNTIIVADVDGFKEGTRLYGISYSQNTYGNHKYDIMYNHVITPNSIAISLNEGLSSNTSNSRILYNILETSGLGGDNAARIGGCGTNNTIQNNTNGTSPGRFMSEDELPDWLKGYLNSSYIRTVDLLWLDKKYDGNNENALATSNSSFNSSNAFGNNQNGFATSDSSSNSANGLGNNPNGKSFISKDKGNKLNTSQDIRGINLNPSPSNARSGDLNSTKYTYGESGVNIASASASPSLGNGLNGVNKKAHYVEKEIKKIKDSNDNRIIFIILLILGLIIIGYYKKYTEEG
ncbi:hypothetical protein SAMN02910297_00188 [Methanobrevibacter olleyae]|nr:hypothetical protein SAMN02910297_00188 [Methanobrevibacter olleyae]